MLNLTLHKNDYIMIGDDIRVQYTTRKNTAATFHIGVSAPADVKITHRRIEDVPPEIAEAHRRRAATRRSDQARHY